MTTLVKKSKSLSASETNSTANIPIGRLFCRRCWLFWYGHIRCGQVTSSQLKKKIS